MTDLFSVFPGRVEIDRQQAALQQIDMAVELFNRSQWACAITLALAAETQLPQSEKPSVASIFRSEYGKAVADRLNEPRDWLKHAREPDTRTLFELDAVLAILRAISKFAGLYGEWSRDMAAFDAWVRQATSGAVGSANSN